MGYRSYASGADWSMVGGQSQTRPGLDKGIMLTVSGLPQMVFGNRHIDWHRKFILQGPGIIIL